MKTKIPRMIEIKSPSAGLLQGPSDSISIKKKK
jgi:hypothetical protein